MALAEHAKLANFVTGCVAQRIGDEPGTDGADPGEGEQGEAAAGAAPRGAIVLHTSLGPIR